MVPEIKDITEELGINNQLVRILMNPTIYMIINQISDNVNTIELASEVIVGNIGVITQKMSSINTFEGRNDMKMPRNQLVLYEELNQLVKYLNKSEELDAWVSFGNFKNANKVAKVKQDIDEIREMLKRETPSFDHMICTRAIVKYGRKHTNLPTKLTKIKQEMEKVVRELEKTIAQVNEIKQECQKPNGMLRWYTRKAWIKIKTNIWMGRNKQGEVITEIYLDGRNYKRKGFDTIWTQVLNKESREKYFGGIAVPCADC